MRDALGRLNKELYPPLHEIGFELQSQGPRPFPRLISGTRRSQTGASEGYLINPPANTAPRPTAPLPAPAASNAEARR
jgi:hypothetical protein